ncbi:MAG TPA: hypothetical protein VFI34_11420 [Candidatus Limnocylindrales bacterium]|nr:hypothetical protein [Candidatus Limnocylindrales bacterium]
MADQLVTLDQVKGRIFPGGTTDAVDDGLLGELIDQVTDWIQEFTGRHFIAEVGATYIVDTTAGSFIDVRRGVRAVTTLSLATSDQPDDGSGTYTAVTAADVLLRPSPMDRRPGWPATGILIKGSTTGRLVTALNGAKIVGDFGFASVPPAIQAVALDAVATAYTTRRAGADQVGDQASPVAVWSRYFAAGTAQRATLERYRAGAGIA